MTRHPFRWSLLASALAASSTAAAQTAAPTPATPEACVSITTDATRLACYDAALKRTAADTRTADSAAQEAKELARQDRESAAPTEDAPLSERARHRVGSLFHDSDVYDAALANAGKGSLLDSRWELAKDSKLGLFQLRAYKPVYVLPAFWTSDRNETPQSPNPANTVTTPEELDSLEAKFQLSFKTKIVENLFGDNGDIWGAYTQSSRWQVYNSENSRPFRETNYEPEVMLVFRNNYSIAGWRGRMAGISLNHQSNGRSDPLSRSWNRAILNIGLDRENWALTLRPWYRIKEDASDDNNADIEDYVGRGDATLTYSRDGHEFSVMGRHSLRGGDKSHGALQLDWGFPINRQLRGHLQVFDGYGESLIDYNHKATYVGLGISLLEWF
ncbi:MAG TPA: phospholipase A [Pseudoxanthomonas sp.]|nr:phospholipase A [Pseudoxanthomonas sp.]